MNFKKRFLLLIIFSFFALFLVFQGSALAGCANQYYYTQCNDEVTIGRCCWGSSDGTCCSEHEVCEEECDEEGNCTEECHDVCDSWCRECRCNRSWYEYSCGSAVNCICGNGDPQCCDGDIVRRKCYSKEEGDCSMGSCESESCHFDRCDASELCEECQSWQKPVRAGCGNDCTKWGTANTRPECKCCGECIKAPTGLKIYQSPDSSISADSPAKLPVRLDWNDVPGFWSGGGGGGGGTAIQDYAECQRGYIDGCWEWAKEQKPDWKCQGQLTPLYLECLRSKTKENCEKILEEDDACKKSCPALEEGGDECFDPDEFVKSYVIEITAEPRKKLRGCNGSDIDSYTEVLGVSEFFAPCPCFFKSNVTYTWKVKACCTEDGANCGPWSEPMTFKTSPAPELISPYDPDWAGPGRAEPNWGNPTEENPYPVHLEWCSVEEAKSYCIRMYKPGTPFIRMYGQGEPFCPILYSALYCPAIVPPAKDFPIQPYFDFGLDAFTKETDYQWKVATCLNQEGQKCGLNCPEDKICYTFETLKSECGCCDFSQLWNFFGHVGLSVPELISPKDGEFVNFTHALQWSHVPGANSYRYEIKRSSDSSIIINKPIIEEYLPIKDLWDKGILTFNTQYLWHIQPCWDQEGMDCESDVWSVEWSFTVSGAPPTGLQADAAIIPVKLSWEDVPGALTYYHEVAKDSGFSSVVIPEDKRVLEGYLSEFSVDYPYLVQDTDYYWRIKTCIDEKGEVCGGWSNVLNFKTFILGKPTEPYPSDGGEFYTYERYLKWKEVLGARAYQYEVFEGAKTIPLTKVSVSSAYVDTPRELGVGEHIWHVKACLDENCQEVGDFSDVWHFNVVEAEPPGGESGLVPCGRDVNLSDPYGIDETERCGFQHLFLLLRNILDLALWRIGLIILVLLVLASGIIFYFSGQLGIYDPVLQVKALWKAAGIGYLVIFLAYTLVNVFLAIFGYKIGVFGPWWIISF